MLNIKEILQNKVIEEPKKTETNQRRFLNKQIDDIHHSVHERILRKKENWKRYYDWCKKNKKSDGEENRREFKKKKECIKEYKSLWYLTSHIPTEHLYFLVSNMKDCINRGTSASAWLLSNLSIKK